MADNKKTIKVWAAVNKNGFLVLTTDKPTKNMKSGKWEGNYYVNSTIYNMVKDLFSKANFNWQNEAEYFEFGIS